MTYFEELHATLKRYHLDTFSQPCPVCHRPMGIIAFIPPRQVTLHCSDPECPAYLPTVVWVDEKEVT